MGFIVSFQDKPAVEGTRNLMPLGNSHWSSGQSPDVCFEKKRKKKFVFWWLPVPLLVEWPALSPASTAWLRKHLSDLAVCWDWVIQCQWNISDRALSTDPASNFSSGFSPRSLPYARLRLREYESEKKISTQSGTQATKQTSDTIHHIGVSSGNGGLDGSVVLLDWSKENQSGSVAIHGQDRNSSCCNREPLLRVN